MKDSDNETARSDVGLHGKKPALQVICLGASGGPSEENVTGFLVRLAQSNWEKSSVVAIDAGSHLAPIVRILERDFPSVSDRLRTGSNGSHASNGGAAPASVLNGEFARASPSPAPSVESDELQIPEPTVLSSGPFAGLKFPNASARANALHVLKAYISTYLITHPHLDHISGFAINTAAFHATGKAKTLAALPSTVEAIKQHIFNDVIWPNLTDEDGGVGFVTFQRLKEGGDVMLGEGEGRGYIEVVGGVGVRAFKVSHGTCTKGPPSHHHRGSVAGLSESQLQHNGDGAPAMVRSGSLSQNYMSAPGTPGVQSRQSFYTNQPSPNMQPADTCVVDSTAFFIRDAVTQREVLVFGDVEPDSISLSPRNRVVWQEAARKVAHGLLGGVFIECSYDDSQGDNVLFGHLNPRHLIFELQILAALVTEAKAARVLEKSAKKRKRSGQNGMGVAKHAATESDRKRSRSLAGRSMSKDLRRSSVPDHTIHDALVMSPADYSASMEAHHNGAMSPRTSALPHSGHVLGEQDSSDLPLSGIKVVIIHIKDTFKDGPHVSENILTQLYDHEQRLRLDGQGLGCEFVISRSGESYWF